MHTFDAMLHEKGSGLYLTLQQSSLLQHGQGLCAFRLSFSSVWSLLSTAPDDAYQQKKTQLRGISGAHMDLHYFLSVLNNYCACHLGHVYAGGHIMLLQCFVSQSILPRMCLTKMLAISYTGTQSLTCRCIGEARFVSPSISSRYGRRTGMLSWGFHWWQMQFEIPFFLGNMRGCDDAN